MATQYFNPVLFPVLTPDAFISLALENGYNLRQAWELSGISRDTWLSWLYRKNVKVKRRPYLERLHRVAVAMGWLDVGSPTEMPTSVQA